MTLNKHIHTDIGQSPLIDVPVRRAPQSPSRVMSEVLGVAG